MLFRDGRDGLKICQLATNRDHAADIGFAGASNDRVKILGEILTMQVDVTIDEHGLFRICLN